MSPVKGFVDVISPYVALTDLTPIERPSYICGTTNALFETKVEWYDLLASFSSGIVKTQEYKLSTQDRDFIVKVINGMETHGEMWVRQQFYTLTEYAYLFSLNLTFREFLDCVKRESFSNPNMKTAGISFRVSHLYEKYKKNAAKNVQSKGKEAEEVQQQSRTTRSSLSSLGGLKRI